MDRLNIVFNFKKISHLGVKKPWHWQVQMLIYKRKQHTDSNNKINKAISMMRGKSPRSDVEISKKLNFGDHL